MFYGDEPLRRGLQLLMSSTFVFAAAQAAVPHAVAAEVGQGPAIPSKVRKPDEFAVKPWQIDSSADGDLNKDGKPDAALIVSRSADGSTVERKLILALQRKNGFFEKVAESDTATALGCGPSGGIPEVQIKKGVVIVHHYCGSRQRYEYWHKYQLRDSRWMLIGYTANTYDTATTESHQAIDVNLLTGQVSASYTSGNKSGKDRFVEIWASAIDGQEPSPSDWCPHTVVVTPPGKIECQPATLQAVHSKDKLFVKAQMEGTKSRNRLDINLLDAKGKVIPAESARTTVYGYVLNSYDLNKAPLKELVEKSRVADSDEPELRLSVVVKPQDTAGGCKMSTGGKQSGAIFLSKNRGALELKHINMQDGDPVHPFLYELPDEP